jgi:hypothetical protein
MDLARHYLKKWWNCDYIFLQICISTLGSNNILLGIPHSWVCEWPHQVQLFLDIVVLPFLQLLMHECGKHQAPFYDWSHASHRSPSPTPLTTLISMVPKSVSYTSTSHKLILTIACLGARQQARIIQHWTINKIWHTNRRDLF